MPAADTRTLQLQISASAELLVRNLKQVDNVVAEFQRSTNSRLASIDQRFEALGALKGRLADLGGGFSMGGLADAATGATLIALAKRGLDYASSLGEVSQQLGVTTKDLQTYRYAASQVGIDQDTMDKSLAKLTQTMGKAAVGAKEPAKAFGAIGISLADLKGKTAGEILPRIADGLAKITNPAQRAAVEIALFGKAGQQLDTLLAGGSGQINQLSDAAQRLGLVLSDDQIQHADDAADRLSAVKQVLEANIAGVVSDNATAILGLANSLATLTGEIISFTSHNPGNALAILGAYTGARLGSRFGAPGIVIGGTIGMVAGGYLGDKQQEAAQDADTSLPYRLKAFREARARRSQAQAYLEAVTRPGHTVIGDANTARANLHDANVTFVLEGQRLAKATASTRAALDRKGKPLRPPSGVDLPQFMASDSKPKGGKSADQIAREAEAARQKQLADDRAYEGQLRSANSDLARSRLALADTAEDELRVAVQGLRDELASRKAQLADQVSAGRLTDARGKILAQAYEEAEANDELLAQRRKQARTIAEAAERDSIELRGRADLLGLDQRLATTRKEQLRIALQMLDYQERLAKIELQKVIDSPTSSDRDRTNAALSIKQIDEQHSRNVQLTEQQFASPVEQYRTRLHAATDDMRDALEGVAVDGFGAIEDGFVGIINGTESVAGAFKKMAATGVFSTARLTMEKAR